MNAMIFKTVGLSASKAAIKTGMKLRKYSPELMLAGGLIAGGAAIVMACLATKKAIEEKVSEKAHEELTDIQREADEDVQNVMEDDSVRLHGYSSKEDCVYDIRKTEKRKTFKLFRKTAWKYLKIFGPSAFLFLLSVALILASHGVLKKRYISTTIAYKALDEAFKDYRGRIKDAIGEEKELHYFNGTHEGGEDTFIDENGDTHTTKTIVKDIPKKNSPYEFDFNAKTAPGNWEGKTEYNLMFIKQIENYCTDLLQARGHVFLNEALDALGLDRTQEGAIVGWILGAGDDYIDFGISDYYTDEYSDLQDGFIKNLHLNMNVDGIIWNLI